MSETDLTEELVKMKLEEIEYPITTSEYKTEIRREDITVTKRDNGFVYVDAEDAGLELAVEFQNKLQEVMPEWRVQPHGSRGCPISKE